MVEALKLEGNTMLNFEVYKDLEGFTYQVSNTGKVRNQHGLVMKTYTINSGYESIKLNDPNGKRHSFLVHRLVGQVFLGLTADKVINHLDGDRLNNLVTNLEVTTQQGNLQHAKETGRWVYNKPTQGLKLPTRGTTGIASKYHGVCWDKSRAKWSTYVRYQGKIQAQRRFDCEEEAARFRDQYVITHGYDLPLNFK